MNTVTKDVVDILVANAIGALGPGAGWRIYIGVEPTEGDTTITLYDNEGFDEQIVSGQNFESARLQIRVRGLEYPMAYAKLNDIRTLFFNLSKIGPITGTDCTYLGFRAYGTPFFIGKDDRERYQWSFNCDVVRERA